MAIALLVVVVIVAAYCLCTYNALTELRVASVRLENVWVDKSGVSLELGVTLYNPASIDLEVDKVYYQICIDNLCRSFTVIKPVIVPSHDYSTVSIPIRFGFVEAAELVKEYLEGEQLHVRVYIILFAPLRILSVKLTDVELEFKGETSIQRQAGARGTQRRSPATSPPQALQVERVEWISGGRPVEEVSRGARVYARIVLKAAGEVHGVLRVVVKADLAFMPDRVVASAMKPVSLAPGEAAVLLTPVFRAGGLPLLRGYFIVVYLNGVRIYEMPDKYPPRLRVAG